MNVTKVTRQTYLTFFKNIPYIIKISWAWTLLIITILVLPSLLNFSIFYSFFFAILFMACASASIAIAWHQKILDESYPKTKIYISLNKNVFSYLVKSITLFIIGILPMLLLAGYNDLKASIVLPNFNTTNYDYFIYFFLVLIPIFILARFGLILPAKAINKTNYTFHNSWNMTKGKTISIIIILLISSLPMIAINEPNQKIMNYINSIGNNFLLNNSKKLSTKNTNFNNSTKSKSTHLKNLTELKFFGSTSFSQNQLY